MKAQWIVTGVAAVLTVAYIADKVWKKIYPKKAIDEVKNLDAKAKKNVLLTLTRKYGSSGDQENCIKEVEEKLRFLHEHGLRKSQANLIKEFEKFLESLRY
jgi:hypothetical protein